MGAAWWVGLVAGWVLAGYIVSGPILTGVLGGVLTSGSQRARSLRVRARYG